jgi:two-component system chemotaxis response regulator CheY
MIAENIGILIHFRNDAVKIAVINALSNIAFRDIKEVDNTVIEHHTLARNKYDLLITDLNLQTSSSVNFVDRLKKNIGSNRLPVLLIVDESEREYYLPSLDEGLINEFLVHPFTSGSLKKRIFKCAFGKITEKMSILVVDDAAPMRNSLKFSLQQTGFKDIDTAISGETALAALRLKHYDLVITDLNMPRMSGIELVQIIRSDHALRSLPVLIVTAENERHRVLKLIEAGVNGYILKPYTQDLLREKILGLSSYLL